MPRTDAKRLGESLTADHWQLFNRQSEQTVGEFHVGRYFRLATPVRFDYWNGIEPVAVV
jgi:hypothetical protein